MDALHILLVLLPGLGVAPTSLQTAPAATVVVVYEDKAEIEVTNWQFRYKFDCDSVIYVGRYYVDERTSRDVFLDLGERTERGVTERFDRVIRSSELAAIKYDWVRSNDSTKPPDLKRITVRLRNGESIALSSELRYGVEQEPSLEPAVRLIPGVDGGRNATVYLVGQVLRDHKLLEFEMGLWHPGGIRSSETVAEFRFR